METTVRTTLILTACAALAAFCSPTSADGASVPSGTWGGQHIAIEVSAGGATVEFDCAHGTIDGALTVDANGRFEVSGSFTPERGGPIRDDDTPKSQPARYSGTLKDSTLTLNITLTDSNESVGSFTLTRGGPTRLFKCK